MNAKFVAAESMLEPLAIAALVALGALTASAAEPRRLQIPGEKETSGPTDVHHLGLQGRDTLVVSRYGRLERWNWKEGKFLGVQRLRPLGEIVFMNDGRHYAQRIVNDERFTVWDTSTPKHLGWFPDWRTMETASALSPDGQRLAWANEDGIIRVHETREAHWAAIPRDDRTYPLRAGEPKRLEAFTDLVTMLVFSADGNLLASAGLEGKIIIWDVDAGKAIESCAQDAAPTAMCFAPDGKSLVIANDDSVLCHRKLSGEQIAKLPLTSPQRALTFSPDGKFLYAGSESGTLRRIAIDGFQVTGNSGGGGNSAAIRTIRFSPSGKTIFTGHDDSGAVARDAETLQVRGSSPGQREPIVAVLPLDDDRVALGPSSRIWNVADGKDAIVTGIGRARDLARSPDGKRVIGLTLPMRGMLQLTVSPITPPGGMPAFDGFGYNANEMEGFTLCDVSPDGKLLAVSSSNKDEVKLYEIASRKLLRRIAGPAWWLKFMPDSKRLMIYGRDWSLWDSATGTRIRTYREGISETPNSWIKRSIVLSPDGTRIAISNDDAKSITILDVESALPLSSIALSSWENLVQFSKDARLLISTTHGNKDATIWETISGETLFALRNEEQYFRTCLLLDDDRLLAAGYIDGTIVLHEINSDAQPAKDAQGKPTDDGPESEIELARAWAVIVEKDAIAAHASMRRLAAAKDKGVALVAKRLASELPPPVAKEQIQAWIADISGDARKSAAASAQLVRNRDAAWDEINAALRRELSEGARGRLKLIAASKPNPRRTMILERAIAILERAATDDARRELATLVERGRPTRRLAEQALARMNRRASDDGKPKPADHVYADMQTPSCGWTFHHNAAALRIIEVAHGGPAYTAQIRSGDVVLQINDQPVRTEAAIRDLLDRVKIGDTIRVTYRRTGKVQDADVVVRASKAR